MYAVDTIIFDVGGVLLTWDPATIAGTISQDSQIQQLLLQEVFFHSDWLLFDRGLITESDLINQVSCRCPLTKTQLKDSLRCCKLSLKPIKECVQILYALRAQNVRLYCLSNMPHSFYQYLTHRYDFFQCFDGMVISCQLGKIKPEPGIYHYLLQQYHLNPQQCVFIDDRLDNIHTAKSCGFNTLHYHAYDALHRSLCLLGFHL